MFPLSPENVQDGNVAKSGGRTLGIASRDLGSVLSCGEGADAQRPVPAEEAAGALQRCGVAHLGAVLDPDALSAVVPAARCC